VDASLIDDISLIATVEVERLLIVDDENRPIIRVMIQDIIRAALECYHVKSEPALLRCAPNQN
jgi:hypothetical protein